jgi:hypothetical protein
MLEPILAIAKVDIADPHRAKFLRETQEPTWTKSKAEIAEPSRTNWRKDKDEPKLDMS